MAAHAANSATYNTRERLGQPELVDSAAWDKAIVAFSVYLSTS